MGWKNLSTPPLVDEAHFIIIMMTLGRGLVGWVGKEWVRGEVGKQTHFGYRICLFRYDSWLADCMVTFNQQLSKTARIKRKRKKNFVLWISATIDFCYYYVSQIISGSEIHIICRRWQDTRDRKKTNFLMGLPFSCLAIFGMLLFYWLGNIFFIYKCHLWPASTLHLSDQISKSSNLHYSYQAF